MILRDPYTEEYYSEDPKTESPMDLDPDRLHDADYLHDKVAMSYNEYIHKMTASIFLGSKSWNSID